MFKSNSDGHLHHVKRGPGGNSVTTDARQRFAWSLNSRVIDPAKAASIARQHGMRGNVVTAVLQYWTDPRANGARSDIPIGMAVEVWRLVPDNDPNTADPNDPNMKNYFVGAIGGTWYDTAHLPRDEFVREAQAYQKALVQEMRELAGRGRP